MLAKRLIGMIPILNGWVVQSFGFSKFLPLGRPEFAVEFLSKWGIDEILLNFIGPTTSGPDFELVERACKKAFVPIAVGGGIRDIQTMERLLHCGADKIVLGTPGYKNPELLVTASARFGRQFIMACIDYKTESEKTSVFIDGGKTDIGLDILEYGLKLESLGAGEIILQSIDRDGSGIGFDIQNIARLADACRCPILACGGSRFASHFADVFSHTKAAAAVSGNVLSHSQHSVQYLKSELTRLGIELRTSGCLSYADRGFDPSGRPLKLNDQILNDLYFKPIVEEKP